MKIREGGNKVKKSMLFDILIVLFFSVLCYLQEQWFGFRMSSDYGGLTALFVGSILLFVSFIVLYVKTRRGGKALLGVVLIIAVSTLMNVSFRYPQVLFMDDRIRDYYKTEYDADVILRGKDSYYGTAYLVYYLEDEPEYPFRAYARIEDQDLDYEYHHAITAMMIDDYLEKELDVLIDGTFKMSTDSLSIGLRGKPESLEFEKLVENTSFIQMYCILEKEMSENKDELIQNIYDYLRPTFEKIESSIYFAFVEDPVHCEKFTKDFYQDENVYVRLDRPLIPEDKEESKPQVEVDGKWEQKIVDSGVFDEYCSNPSFILFEEMDNTYAIKAHPKDVPTISAERNEDGTYSTERFYIVEKEWKYEKDSSKHEAKLEMRVQLYHDKVESIECHYYVPEETISNHIFAYDDKERCLYKKSDSEINLSEDLQKQIIVHCEDVIDMLEKLDVKAHELMKEILEEKGLGPVVWNHATLIGE